MKTLRNLFFVCIAASAFYSCSVEPSSNENDETAIDTSRNILSFNELFAFTSDGDHFLGMGMSISEGENAIYIAHRKLVTSNTDERMLKYQIDTDNLTGYGFDHSDLVTKEIEIIGNDVFLVGGSVINRYRTEVDLDPKSVPHERELYRYGATSNNDNLYVIGGGNTIVENDNGGDSVDANLILKYNTTVEKFETEAVMPNRKFYADGSILNDKMYVFGGAEDLNALGTNDIYIYDMVSGSFDTSYQLPKNVMHTFTSTVDGLIFVGGSRWLDTSDNDASFDDIDHFESFLGYFDTATNQFTEIDLPFTDVNRNTLQQIAVNGDNLYVIYGDTENQTDGLKHYSVQVANISIIR